MEKQKRRKKFFPWKPVLLGLLAVALITGAVLFATLFHVEKIEVADTFRSPAEEVLQTVFPDEESRVFYRVVKQVVQPDAVPAFSDLKIVFKSPISVEIQGTEKAPVMQVAGAEKTLYFDENGRRVPEGNSTEKRTLLDGFLLGETPYYEMPVLSEEKASQFDMAVQMSVYINALSIPCDFISVSSEGAMLVFQQVHVSLGNAKHLREKMEEVACQYPYYEGLKGTLHMENYDGTNGGKGFTFTTTE